MQRSLMRSCCFLAFFCCLFQSITAQVAITEKGDVHMRLVYGEGVTGIKGRDINITDYLKSRLSTLQLAPYKNIQIATRWWILMGDLVYNTGIVWNYNNSFSFYHPRTQQNYVIDKRKLSRYPSLLTMLENARPLKWNMRINVNCAFATTEWKGNIQTEFKLFDNDVIIFPEGKEPLMVSGSPRSFSDRIRFVNKDTRGTVGSDLNYWNALQSVTSLNSIEGLDFVNPVEEWYRIVQLYDKYEKEGNELEEEYSLVSDNHVPEAVANARSQSGWDTPLEEPNLEGTVVRDKSSGRYNIEAGGRKMLPLDNNYTIYAIPFNKRYFIAREYGVKGANNCIINSKGKKMTIAGNSMFNDINAQDDQLILTLKNEQVFYKSKFKYGGDFGQDYDSPEALTYFTESEFARFKSRDYERPRPRKSGSGSGLTIGRSGSIMEFKKGKVIKAGKNLEVLFQVDGYFIY